MAKTLLLCTVLLVLAASAAFAAPPAPAAPAAANLQMAIFAPVETAPDVAPVCVEKEMAAALGIGALAEDPPICAGDGCDKTADCRPAGLPECANCWCIGPAGDKWCACF